MLATDDTSSFVLFLYAEIQWTVADLKSAFSGSGSGNTSESGSVPGNTGESGIGLFPVRQPPDIAMAGFFEDTGIVTLLPGSGTEDIRNLKSTSNVGKPGLWVFKVDGNITFGGTVIENMSL